MNDSLDICPHCGQRSLPQMGELVLRSEGKTYQAIADRFGFSIASVWKCIRKWELN